MAGRAEATVAREIHVLASEVSSTLANIRDRGFVTRMEVRPIVSEQVVHGLVTLEANPRFNASPDLWLTFYLAGDPVRLSAAAAALTLAGWVNTGGSEDGFLYPKKQSARLEASVLDVIDEMQGVAERFDIRILGIDADTSSDVERSEFVMLYSA